MLFVWHVISKKNTIVNIIYIYMRHMLYNKYNRTSGNPVSLEHDFKMLLISQVFTVKLYSQPLDGLLDII